MYRENTKANLPHKSQTYSSTYDKHPIFGNIGGWVCDSTTGTLKYKLDKNDWSKKADGTLSNLTGADGDVMVKIPAFYIKTTKQANGKPKFEIDDTIPNSTGTNGRTGFYVHPAFKKADGTIRPYFLWGAYKGVEQGGKLRSISGVIPTTNKTKATFQDLARQGRSIDFGITSFFERMAIQLLFYAEFGTLNCQEACGRGIVDLAESSTVPTECRTGGTNSLGDRSGYVGTNGESGVRYRGIEDLWGNVWDFLSGIMITDKGWHYTNDHTKMDNISQMSLYAMDLSKKYPEGYVKEMEYPTGSEWMFFPKTTTGASGNTYFCDYHWPRNVGQENLVLAGARWVSDSGAGLADWTCGGVASSLLVTVGARLSFSNQ